MQRRDFIKGIVGSATAWPLVASAQQGEHMRRIGVLMARSANDPEGQAWVAAFLQGLQELGWSVGRNAIVDIRWFTGNSADARKYAAELVVLAPDVILANTSIALTSLQQVAPTVPIIFAGVADPVGAGYVDSLARPGGNITGFTVFDYSISGKWLQLLKEIAPGVTRVAVTRDPSIASGPAQFAVIQAAAPSLGVELRPVDVRDEGEIERAIATFAQNPNSGLIVTGSPLAVSHRDLIIALATRHRLPAVYFNRFWAAAGGLISYGPDLLDPFRRAAGYVDRILKGEKPADLPIQQGTKLELFINAKSAKVLGIAVPLPLSGRADEVIE
jgi:putative tryptophan/tyrosine transport system substrate-binding protein